MTENAEILCMLYHRKKIRVEAASENNSMLNNLNGQDQLERWKQKQ